MHTKVDDSDQKKLFVYNRTVPNAEVYARIAELERMWIEPMIVQLAQDTPVLGSRAEWLHALESMLDEEKEGSPSSWFLADEATLDQFRIYVKEFAPDGLTEAQNFFPAIARIPLKAQMALMRVLIDEFGCGNLQQAHSQLYLVLLEELGLPQELTDFLDDTSDETFAFLNVFYWLTERAPHVEYFLGALAYLEASIPSAFSFLAKACERLGVQNGHYYTEHIHIDNFHMKEMQTAIREYEAVRGVDATKLWIGARLLSTLLGDAVDNAVIKAKRAA